MERISQDVETFPADLVEEDQLNLAVDIPVYPHIIPPSIDGPVEHPLPTSPTSVPGTSRAEFVHSLPALRKPKISNDARFQAAMEYLLDELKYESVVDFFYEYLEPLPPGSIDPFIARRKLKLQAFLGGRTRVKPIDLIQRMYYHRYSFPSRRCVDKEKERKAAFSPSEPPATIKYARCSISAWATQLVGEHVHREMEKAIHPAKPLDPDQDSGSDSNSNMDNPPFIPPRLVASANERTKAKGVQLVTKELLMS
ncbi:hypothetical protein D9758_015849 [Tetrapyrgos nigripes]|uniref:Uncharacterized protein n=1 Tax=Tetrapyrgos nigripes TaxID=182062 RepID=A0A8H5FHN8_9AGAR|nr:hypothetical protein D9758_015849 [Tetrapyrgos nigripes]